MTWRTQHSVEIFLPVRAADGGSLPRAAFEALRSELAERHGGVTAYTRAPAEGLWAENGRPERDDIIVLEVLVDRLDEAEWLALQQRLQTELGQEEILIRTYEVRRLA